jgi:hypothetical protein
MTNIHLAGMCKDEDAITVGLGSAVSHRTKNNSGLNKQTSHSDKNLEIDGP